jgi:hypothetical protein
MITGRRLMLKAAAVTILGGAGLLTAKPAEAAVPTGCNDIACADGCATAMSILNYCGGCTYGPQCAYVGDCDGTGYWTFVAWCGPET